MTALTDPLTVGGCEIPNRLYRAPLLECAGNGPDAVDAPVLCVGGIWERTQCAKLLGAGRRPACDMVGMGRPFYAEPRLPARLLDGGDRVLCESCNNCTVPQVAGEPGRCRTPSVVRARARLDEDGAYETGE